MKHFILLSFLFNFLFSFAQMPNTFGKVTSFERNLETYDNDLNAHAVVLFERGDNYFKVINRRVRLVKEYHTKIKILDEKAFDQATISILLRKNEKQIEKLDEIRAITHNGSNQSEVRSNEIFEKDINENLLEKTFTFPKVKKGSILEYKYTIVTPFYYNFRGWNFQSNIPKIYSEFNAKIPANYSYNRALIGNLKLDVNDSNLKKNCFYVEGFVNAADCEVIKYAMNNVPAFKIEEDYMLASSNYLSRLEFELSELTRFDGTKDKYTRSWKDVDNEFRGDKNIGRQLTKKSFFENHITDSLLNSGIDELTKAKNIYTFVQNHFTWNKEYGIFGKARVKSAFEKRKGNISEINMSLINLLNAAGIKSNLMLLSTRNQGLPKKSHPVMNDFNYAIAKVEINNETFLLDASNKYLPFGMLPFKALNHYGRVMDFKNESYWFDIKPETKNKHQVRAFVKFNTTDKKAQGILDVTNFGYEAVNALIKLDDLSEDEYLDEIENDIDGDMEVIKHQVITKSNTDKRVSERFEFEMKNLFQEELVYFNPFLVRFFGKNPFSLEERNYPVDFGYNRQYKYQMNMQIPDGYVIKELPENQVVNLGEKLVELKFYNQKSNNNLAISFELTMNKSHFSPSNYEGLKGLFNHVTNIQNNSLIVLKKQ